MIARMFGSCYTDLYIPLPTSQSEVRMATLSLVCDCRSSPWALI